MKATYNWLRDFVGIKISAKELAHKLTMAGLEVVSLEKKEDDWILELEITSNRSDCLSVIGIAREVSAITHKRLNAKSLMFKEKYIKHKKLKIDQLSMEIENKNDCPLYTARLIRDVKVKSSPKWLAKRLENVGVRPVNNIVDITNYVLLETGQPLHAFDYDKLINNKIFVRRAREGERIVTIDGIERELNPEILVISDCKRAVAIAGIMGGKDTEVTEETKNILLESAEFNPLTVRRQRRSLSLATESSYRFERGTNKSNVIFASNRAGELIREISGGILRSFKIEGIPKEKERIVFLNPEDVGKILGKKISSSKIKEILKSLQFKIKQKKALEISIPPFRKDIKEEIDLIEEIGRIYGYDDVPLTLPYIKVSSCKEPIQDKIKDIIKLTLLKIGLNEVITYSLTDPDYFKEEFVGVANPLSKDFSVLRPSLLFSLLKVLQFNLNRGCDSVGIFELAKIYRYKEGRPKEFDTLGILVLGGFSSDWLRGKTPDWSFFDLKGIVEMVLRDLGVEDYELKDREIPYLSQAAVLRTKEQIEFGFLGQIDEKILEKFDIDPKLRVYFSQIQIEDLISSIKLKKEFKPLPLFPSIRRDISLIVKRDISCEQILKILKEKGGELLSTVSLFDRYEGRLIPEDSVSLSFSLEYQSKERTLTNEEVNSLHKEVMEHLIKNLNIKIRGEDW